MGFKLANIMKRTAMKKCTEFVRSKKVFHFQKKKDCDEKIL